MKELNEKVFNFLNNIVADYQHILKVLLVILIIYTIIYTIIFFISMYKLAVKEKQPIKKYVIPVINWWYYFKLCNIPPWLILIPILNIITHFVSPIKLAYEYKYRASIGTLGVFFPFIILPIIAFGPNKSRRRLYEATTLKTVKSLDIIEEKLESTVENDFEFFDEQDYVKKKKEIKKNSIDEKIEAIEANAVKDDYEDALYGDDMNEKVKAKIVIEEMIKDEDYELAEATKAEEEIVELEDAPATIKTHIEQIEENIENRSKLKVEDNSNYKDYEFLKNENSTIAFGGQSEVKKKARNVTEEKHGRNRCPRCNTAIDETMAVCPGCGQNLRG